jgi:Phage tail protein.
MINGARYAVATQLALAVAITALTNADPANATGASAPALGDVLLLSSGWTELDDAPARAANVVGSAFDIEGYDTTDVSRFPAGEGVGAFRVASNFVNLPKIHDIQASGGDQNFAQRQYVSDPTGKQVQAPTFKAAQSRVFMLDYDPSKPHFDALIEIDRKKEIVILRETLPNGDVIYNAGYLSFNKEPTRAMNEFMSNQMTFSLSADSIRYDAAP